ncbi:MAG: DUF3617 family protein [Rhodanobacteraceae bacterium]
MSRTLISIGLMALVLAAGAVHAGAKNVRWSVNVDVNMIQPMSMKMPTHTTEVCGAADPEKNPPPMKNGNCQVQDFQHAGKRAKYTVSCKMKGITMVGDGWVEKIDKDHYKGHMSVNGDAGGTAMAMDVSYKGARVGTCTDEGVE